jgi:hypothetical protein
VHTPRLGELATETEANVDTYALLKQAIAHKRQVVARYDGAIREFCPHALGTKGVERHVLAYQIGGESRSGLPRTGEWRCFKVDELTDMALRTGPWQSAPNVFNPQSCLDEVEVAVQPFPPVVAADDP